MYTAHVAPTPPMAPKPSAPKTPVAPTVSAAAAAKPAAPAAEPIIKEVKEPEVVVTTEEVEQSRAAEIEELPEFANVTGLTAVESGITIHLTPLRSKGWADFYFDEATSVSAIMGKTQGLIRAIDAKITEKLKGFDLASVSVSGAVEVAAVRCSEPFKNGRCGVYKFRVLEACSEAVMGAIGEEAVATPAFGIEYTHETIISDEFYPGAVIEQIAEQNGGLAAAYKRDFSIGKNVFVYQVRIASAAQLAIIEKRGHLVRLGVHGAFALRAVERKVTFETIYAYGCSGVGSAKDILQEPLAASLAVPKGGEAALYVVARGHAMHAQRPGGVAPRVAREACRSGGGIGASTDENGPRSSAAGGGGCGERAAQDARRGSSAESGIAGAYTAHGSKVCGGSGAGVGVEAG